MCCFVCERDSKPYPPNTLCCGLMRGLNWHLRDNNEPEVNFLTDSKSKAVLDSRMKELQSTGKYQVRKAEPISENLCLLGPHVLLDTVIYFIFCAA